MITINPNDKAFISDGCGKWTQDLSAITTSKTSFSDGMYIVGTDIEPGTYKSSGQDGCYWERMGDFSGNNILDNDNASGQAVVTINATDKGFISSRCGIWNIQEGY